MRKSFYFCLMLLCAACQRATTLPDGIFNAKRTVHVFKGQLMSFNVLSEELQDTMKVDIWLPPTYSATGAPSPVLYMHDGQNIFDANTTWNHESWNIDSVLSALPSSINKPIVVGIYNRQTRFVDYLPANYVETMQNHLDRLRPSIGTSNSEAYNDYFEKNVKPFIDSDNPSQEMVCHSKAYIDFLTNTLKPFIDSTFNVLPDRDNTYVMGSSMGALVSVYAVQYRPDVFGTGAGLSYPATLEFWDVQKETWMSYATSPNVSRLYLDNGTGMMDSAFIPHFIEIEPIMRQNGWDEQHFCVKIFPDADHTESAWERRLHVPLMWMLNR